MSRFLITSMPIESHVFPATAIAAKLIERGHEVGWYTGSGFRKKVEALGCTFFPLATELDFDHGHVEKVFPERGQLKGIKQLKWDIKHLFVDPVPRQLEDIEAIRSRFDYQAVLSDPIFMGSLMMQEKGGPPVAIYGLFTLMMSSRDTAPAGPGMQPSSSIIGRIRNGCLTWFFYRIVFADVQSHFNRMRNSIGLPSSPCHILDFPTTEASLYLQGTAMSFEYPRCDMPPQVRFIGPILPAKPEHFNLPEWWHELDGSRPVVLVTQGVVDLDYDNLLIPAIKALEDEDLLVVAVTGGPAVGETGLTNLPDNVRMEKFIPYHQLLTHVDVVVTSGGYGTVHFALSQGVPLVTAGIGEGKAEVCARVQWSGTGINLKTEKPKAEKIRQAVLRVLADPSYKQNAVRIRDDFVRHDAPSEAALLLEELVGSKAGTPGKAEVMNSA